MVEGHVVKDFMLGGTRVKICDDFCRDKTPEEVDAILARVAQVALRHFEAVAINQNKQGEHNEETEKMQNISLRQEG